MAAYERFLRPLLFRLSPETAHHTALWAIARGLIRQKLIRDPRLERRVLGLTFPNPIGLAAGLDKDGIAVDRWADLNFGFAEIGTVTAHPQPGNDPPRLFRLPDRGALINRMGFNNAGSEALSRRLAHAKPRIPLGINLGKSKVTPLTVAAQDYETSMRRLQGLGDYFVINVSSPNTPGLRSLQDRSALSEIASAVTAASGGKPVLIKVSPDLTTPALEDIVDLSLERGVAGLIATNTTMSRPGIPAQDDREGGLSGRPLRPLANEALAAIAAVTAGRLVLIGVGGIEGVADVQKKFALGADLVQVYTGFVYAGPGLLPHLLLNLLESGPEPI